MWLICFGGGFLLLTEGFGVPMSSTVKHGMIHLIGYFICAALFFFPIFNMVKRKQLLSRVPFVPGTYLLPTAIVESKGSDLEIWLSNSLIDINVTHYQKNGSYTHSTLEFLYAGEQKNLVIRSMDETISAISSFTATQKLISAAAEEKDLETLLAYDVFLPCAAKDWEAASWRTTGFSAPHTRAKLYTGSQHPPR